MAVIQVLEKANYAKQHLVTVQDAAPTPLAASSVRVRTSVMSLTTNNLSYARIGDAFGLGWWSFWKLPADIPEEFSDASKYCRVSCWGIATVLESNVDGIAPGNQLYGYFPIGTRAEDLLFKPLGTANHFVESSPHRETFLKIYNDYGLITPSESLEKDSLGWDSLMRVLFLTSWCLNTVSFPWDSNQPVHPQGAGDWTSEQGNITDAVVILFAPSGKTGLSFAHVLRHDRPKEVQPRTIVAVGSEASKAFAQQTGFFDQVLTYDGIAAGIESLGITSDTKVVLANFGARGTSFEDWSAAVKQVSSNVIPLVLGSEPVIIDHATLPSFRPPSDFIHVNASGIRDVAMARLGNEFFPTFANAWGGFKANGAIPGLKLIWRDGMDAVGQSWVELCEGKLAPDQGWVFTL